MSTDASVTLWITQLKQGNSEAADALWQTYFPRLVDLARRKLQGAKRSVADEEDVAACVLKSLFMGAPNGRFPKMVDRESLWSLLCAITANKSVDMMRKENRAKRGGNGVDANANVDSTRQEVPLEGVTGQIDTAFSALMSEQFETLIAKLDESDDPELIQIAIRKMMGDSSVEIAEDLRVSRRTVERKVETIRKIWETQWS